MKIIVIGLGSMGKRRIRLLKTSFKIDDVIGIDLQEERRKSAEQELGIVTHETIENACNKGKYDAVFVCTPPLSHAKVIDSCLENNLNVFTEINLVADQYDMLISKAKGKGCKLFLSSTMLFRKEIQYIKDRINNYNEATNYMYHVGQYLPDWHPWESYKHFFVNEKRSNGCRELFAIELPWIIKTFGQVESIIVHKSKMTNLDIVYCDNYMVTIVHQTGHKGTIMLDIVSRKATRRLEIIGEEIYLMWEGTPQSLKEYDFKEKIDQPIETYSYIDKNHNYSENIIENAYVDEIREFLEILQGKEKISYTFEEDKIILGIIDQIEEQ